MKIIVTIIFTIISLQVYAQLTPVENIIANSQDYIGNTVTTQGLVVIYQKGSGNTNYYILRGNYGGLIRVNTAEEPPDINKIYKVEGIVYYDVNTRSPFISERKKYPLEENKQEEKLVQSENAYKTQSVGPQKKESAQQLIGLAILLIILLSVYIFTKQKQLIKSSAAVSSGVSNLNAPQFEYDQEPVNEKISDYEFKTIKITTESPKTLKFIPGKLTIISGDDIGKSFKIAGYPTNEGNIVTVGRQEIRGERAYSHIQLIQKTVSRKQAEIIQQGDKLYIKNLSETNPTQINGLELKPLEKSELNPGDIIRFGELELKYEL
ncbi:FHA domain-containing protein [Rosettibacter firmus]|uniref:FHA domain-containing protein n=1 Tax=Rosettibacter firmus TaxID=3111522 RepID=UPI00336C2799